LEDSNQTKSSDFLPGKPSIDGMMRGSSSTPANASSTSDASTQGKMPDTASAHVIDLKNSNTTIADSPLFEEEPVKESAPAKPADVTLKVDAKSREVESKEDKKVDSKIDQKKSIDSELFNEESSTEDQKDKTEKDLADTEMSDSKKDDSELKPAAETDTPKQEDSEPEKDLNELSLASSIEQAKSESSSGPAAKKSSILKIVLIVFVAILAVAIIATGAIMLLNNAAK
jgi:cobalamin biosynthesis Mg chelatase CobN